MLLLQKKKPTELSRPNYISPVLAYEQRNYTLQLLLHNAKNARVLDTWIATVKEHLYADYAPETTIQGSISITPVRQKALALT